MLSLKSSTNVYLACGSSDMRKGIDGLAVIIQMTFQLDPFSDCLFVFCNKKRDKLKIIFWDRNGFWLLSRRLEKGRFKWPDNPGEKVLKVTQRELQCVCCKIKVPKVANQNFRMLQVEIP